MKSEASKQKNLSSSRIPRISLNSSMHKPTGSDCSAKDSFREISSNNSFSIALEDPRKPKEKNSVSTSAQRISLGTPRSLVPKHVNEPLNTVKTTLKKFDLNSNFVIVEKTKSSRIHTSRFPMPPSEAIKRFSSSLQGWEQDEILNFSEVYYIGKTAKGKEQNYTDDYGNYKIIVKDHIAYRYEVVSLLGQGSFGQVLEVFDHCLKKPMALKIIKNRPKFHQQAKMEVGILKLIKDCDSNKNSNIIEIIDNFVFRSHMCILFDMLSLNLYEFLKKNCFKGLSMSVIKRIAFQMFNALYTLKGFGIIHCDIKPENILLVNLTRTSIKLIDLGSACYQDQTLYSYIQSRFYRAPEIILGIPYTSAIDTWSLGCVLVELYTGIPLFPGENESEQLLCIMELLGLPPQHLLESSTKKGQFFDENLELKTTCNSRGKPRIPATRSLKNILKGADIELLNLIEMCLQWDPETRIKPEAALKIDWLKIGVVTKRPMDKRKTFVADSKQLSSIKRLVAHRTQLSEM